MENGQPVQRHSRRSSRPLAFYIALFIVLVFINTLAAKFAVFSFAIFPGISSFYVVVGLMILFTLWFGMWGAVSAYVGCFIGAGILSGIPPGVNLFWSLADFWQVLIPLLAFRMSGAEVLLKGTKDLLMLIVFGILLNNLAGAIWGSATLALGGVISWNSFIPALSGWLAGNIVVSLVLVPLLLYYITPVIRSRGLFVRNYWQ